MGYDYAEYLRPEFQWAQHNFVSPQVMVEERTLFDVDTNRWTVDKYLDDLEKRYGGIDSVLLWPVYPNIGIDNRNQWDRARNLPGGVQGVRKTVDDFHRRNVRVLFPTMAWDNGTRDPGVPHWTATAQLMAEFGVDGVNGDTFGGVPWKTRGRMRPGRASGYRTNGNGSMRRRARTGGSIRGKHLEGFGGAGAGQGARSYRSPRM